jgi:hypothetical protein
MTDRFPGRPVRGRSGALGDRGGFLLDLFLIVAILAAAAAGWVAWRRGSLRDLLRTASAVLPAVPASPAAQPMAEPDIDVSDRSAWIQGRVRDLLSKSGVKEKHVLRTFNAQRQEGGIQWLEDTLEVRRPAVFDERQFLLRLAPLLAEKKLSLMEDRREGSRRELAVGDRKRVYQRLILE